MIGIILSFFFRFFCFFNVVILGLSGSVVTVTAIGFGECDAKIERSFNVSRPVGEQQRKKDGAVGVIREDKT